MKKAICVKKNNCGQSVKKIANKNKDEESDFFDIHVCPLIETKEGNKWYRGCYIPNTLIDLKIANLFTWLFPEGECTVFTVNGCNKVHCKNCIVRTQNRKIFDNYRKDVLWNPKEGGIVWKIKFNTDTIRWTYSKDTCSKYNAMMSKYTIIFRTREQARIACNKINAIMKTPNAKAIANIIWPEKNS